MFDSEHTKLKADKKKIQESILYLMALADGLTQYEIAKAIFLADRAHLNKYGRPVTFDNYVAMEHGPVPSLAYTALKPETNYKAAFGNNRPWLVCIDPDNKKIKHYTRVRDPNLEYLSSTDIDALRTALGTVRSLSFSQLRRLTHEDPAYLEAWKSRGEKQAHPMKLPLLYDDADDAEELADDLAYISAKS